MKPPAPAAAPLTAPAPTPAPASKPAALPAYTRLCALLSRLALGAAIVLLLGVVLCVQWQVFGRYVLNDTPTWAESLALLLVLYVTAFGLAVGVRDAGHIGLESLLVLLPQVLRQRAELLIHALVGLFGAFMVWGGSVWVEAKWGEKKAMLPLPDAVDYLPLVIAGVLIVLFSLEHIIALLQGRTVEPAWN